MTKDGRMDITDKIEEKFPFFMFMMGYVFCVLYADFFGGLSIVLVISLINNFNIDLMAVQSVISIASIVLSVVIHFLIFFFGVRGIGKMYIKRKTSAILGCIWVLVVNAYLLANGYFLFQMDDSLVSGINIIMAIWVATDFISSLPPMIKVVRRWFNNSGVKMH